MESDLECFDWAANFYDYTRNIPEILLEKIAKVIKNQVNLTKSSKILEIGIGTGRIAIPLAIKMNNFGSKFYGIDISEEMLTKCRKNAETQCLLQLILAEGSQLPFSIEFDIILTSHVLHLVKNPFQFIELLLQNLSPKGRYINLEAYVNYQKTLPFSLFYQKLHEAGYHHFFRGDLINREISVYLTQRRWKYQRFTYNAMTQIKINTLVRFLRNRVFSHQRAIPSDLYYHSLDYLYRELEERGVDLSAEVTAPSISRLNLFYQ